MNRLRSLLSKSGDSPSIEALLSAVKITDYTSDSIKKAERAASQVQKICDEKQIQIKYSLLDSYPILYLLGNDKLLYTPQKIGMIGTRTPSQEVKQNAHSTAKKLAENGITIVSGLAKGCDTAAHEGALSAGGSTIAVLPCGILSIYPTENRPLAQQIGKKGLLVSEYPPYFTIQPYAAIQRNYLLEQLSDQLLLCQSGLQGGSKYAIKQALIHKKRVFALPLPLESYGETLNRQLIRSKKAEPWCTASNFLAQENHQINLSYRD